MKTTFIEKDFINEIRDNVYYKKWEIASPSIFKKIYQYQKELFTNEWNTITLDTVQYMYNYIQLPTVFGMSRIYILCRNSELFKIPEIALSDAMNVYEWLSLWGRKHILITMPILYDTEKGQLTSWNIYSKKKYYESIERNAMGEHWHMDEENTILNYFLESKCFSLASGHIYLIGLHRSGITKSSILMDAFSKWAQDFEDHQIDWSIQFEDAPLESMIFVHTGLNASIGEHPLLYALYGDTDIELIEYLLKQFEPPLGPICEIVTNLHTNTPSIYYISIYSKLFSILSDESWNKMHGYLNEMSLSPYTSMLNEAEDSYQVQISFFSLIENSFRYKNESIKKQLFDFIQNEINVSKNIFIKTLFGMSFMMYNDVKYKHLRLHIMDFWHFMQKQYFKNDIEWSQGFHQYLLETYYNTRLPMPPWRFFHWMLHKKRWYTMDVFHNSELVYTKQTGRRSSKIYVHRENIYTTLKLFSHKSIPYLFRKHILQKQLQDKLWFANALKKHIHKGIGDSMEWYFTTHKSECLRR
jgi:hypothetical protein